MSLINKTQLFSNKIILFTKHIHTNTKLCKKIIPNNLKGKKASSQHWLVRQLKDPYVEKAKLMNYR